MRRGTEDRRCPSGPALAQENAPAVAEIVRQLDGLPLAVELAAARVRALAPEAMVARLGSRLRLLTSGPRDADERQRTLRAAIQWSYDLLPPNEQTLFGSLSVFVGGCRLEDAEAVCDSGGALGMDVLEGVASLVDKSLLRRRVDPDGESRYGMLETIREFAADACANSARAALHEQHARHFAAVAEQFDHAARVDAQEGSLERLDPEIGNLRAALEWAQEAGDREIAVRLVTALTRYWATRGYISEGLGRVEEAVAGIDAPPQTMIGLCLLRHLAGYDARAGLADARRALVALEELGDDVAQAQAWHLVGRLHASGLSEISAGEQAWERALEFAERAQLRAERAEIMGWLMVMAMFGPQPTSEGISRCEAFLRSAGDDLLVRAFASIEIAVLRAMRGEFAEARSLLAEGRQIFLDLGHNVWAANTAQRRSTSTCSPGTRLRPRSSSGRAATH